MNKKNVNISDRQLFEYLNDTSSETEKRLVEEWIQQGEKQKSYFKRFKEAFDTADAYPRYNSIDVNRKWEEFNLLANKKQAKNKVNFLASHWAKIAASILLIIAAGYSIFFFSKPATITYEYTEINPVVILPDASTVYLQPGAILTANEEFNREVHLKGEAFFHISADPNNTFTVDLNNSRIQVLGTSFNIKSEPEVEVKLYEGKIRFQSQTETFNLEPGDEIAFNPETKTIANRRFNDTITKLQFNGTEFKNVVALLEKKFLYKFRLSPEIANEKVTGQFTSNESISEILQILSRTLEFEYTIVNRHITITTEITRNKSPDENN